MPDVLLASGDRVRDGEAGAGEAGADTEEAAGDGEGISVSDGRLWLIFLDREA